MKYILKAMSLSLAILITSCNQLKEDACYDMNHLWDPEKNICTDDCIRQGGIFEVADRQCEISLSGGKETKQKELLSSVQTTCSDIQSLLEKEFDLIVISPLKHLAALDYDYLRLAPISYTSKYNFGQDGVCNFAGDNNDRIKIFIRKNARVESKYSTNEFDILKIELKQADIETSDIIWERD